MKLWEFVQPNETISIAELYRRVYNESGNYIILEVFFNTSVTRERRLKILPCSNSQPYRVTRNQTFFEKALDKLRKAWYTVSVVRNY